MKRIFITLLVVASLSVINHASAATDFYVNPESGLDTASGRSTEMQDGNGPFKTIAHAIATAKPGDTVHLAPLTYVNEAVLFRNKSGEPGNPITLDGHGAMIDGSDPLKESDWHQVSPGLYRNTVLYTKPLLASEAFVSRFGLVIGGKLNRMGRSGKGHCDPYKAVADLKVGEWTYQANDEHAYFLKIDPKKTLASYNIRIPTRVSAVQIYGDVRHIVIKNLATTHVINDGFGITTGSAPNEINHKVRDILFQNIKAIECCDDGLSSHADCELKIDGFEVDGCATGIANCGTDEINRLFTKNIHGIDVYYYGGKHILRNSYIQAHGNVAPLQLLTLFSNAKWVATPGHGFLYEGWDRCILQMENVAFDGASLPAGSLSKIAIADRSSLDAKRTTVNQLSVVVAKGGSLNLTQSLVMGGAKHKIEIRPEANWLANENIYDIGQISLASIDHPLQKFDAYRSASKQDSKSQARPLDFRQWMARDIKSSGLPPGIGADPGTSGAALYKPTLTNVPYGPHERQVLDFYQAESAQPTPVLIFIHGGGWIAGDKGSLGGMMRCLKAGISIVSINYRYSWQAQLAGVKPPVEWPLHDAARAVQFVRSKATEWNLDKPRIATSGGSAGGCSSLWLALHDDLADPKSSDPIARESTRLWCAAGTGAQTSLDPRQLVEWTPNSSYGGHAFGFMDPKKLASRDTQFAAFLAAREQLLPWIKEYSPYEHATADDPPIYLLYNEAPAPGQEQKDPTHTANYGLKLQEKLRGVGVECELDYPATSAQVHERTSNYLIKRLKTP